MTFDSVRSRTFLDLKKWWEKYHFEMKANNPNVMLNMQVYVMGSSQSTACVVPRAITRGITWTPKIASFDLVEGLSVTVMWQVYTCLVFYVTACWAACICPYLIRGGRDCIQNNNFLKYRPMNWFFILLW